MWNAISIEERKVALGKYGQEVCLRAAQNVMGYGVPSLKEVTRWPEFLAECARLAGEVLPEVPPAPVPVEQIEKQSWHSPDDQSEDGIARRAVLTDGAIRQQEIDKKTARRKRGPEVADGVDDWDPNGI
jgi:hypothetical protein